MTKLSHVENAFVRCPYYKYERQCVLYCEGQEAGSSLHMAFSSGTRRKEYEQKFCQQNWRACMIAAVHNRRWDYGA